MVDNPESNPGLVVIRFVGHGVIISENQHQYHGHDKQNEHGCQQLKNEGFGFV
jgi:hypothetical protein